MTFEMLAQDAEAFVKANGPVAVGIVIFFESFGAPLPGESLLVLSGVLAARGEISLVWLLVSAWVGAIAGDSVGYWIGRKFGRALIVRHGSRVGLTDSRFTKVESVFVRYGPLAVAFARFFDILRQLNGLVAGTAGMNWPRFLMFNAIGATLWIGTWGFGAWYFAGHVSNFRELFGYLGAWGTAAVLAAGATLVAGVIILARRTARGPSAG